MGSIRYRLRPRRTALLTVAALLASVGLGAASSPADAHPPPAPHVRYVLVTGSPNDLVYLRIDSPKPEAVFDLFKLSSATLRVLTKSGRRKTLGQVGTEASIGLVGSILVVANPTADVTVDPTDNTLLVRWWNLASGAHGNFQTQQGFADAMPGGWLYVLSEGNNQHLIGKTFGGKRTDYGDPLPPGISYGLLAGPAGFLAVSNDEDDDGNASVVYTPLSDPAKTVTLAPASSDGSYCGGLSSTYAACLDYDKGMELLPLDGAKATERQPACSGDRPTLLRASVVWLTAGSRCEGRRVGQMTKDRSITYSHRTFYKYNLVAALGRIVVTSPNESQAFGLTSATATPHLLLH